MFDFRGLHEFSKVIPELLIGSLPARVAGDLDQISLISFQSSQETNLMRDLVMIVEIVKDKHSEVLIFFLFNFLLLCRIFASLLENVFDIFYKFFVRQVIIVNFEFTASFNKVFKD